MNLWIEGPIKAPCTALPLCLPSSRPLSPSLPHVVSFLSSSLFIPFTVPWSSLPLHPCLLILLFLLTLPPILFIHLSILTSSQRQTVLWLAVSLSVIDSLWIETSQLVMWEPGQVNGLCYHIKKVGCNVEEKVKAWEEGLERVPMVTTEAPTLEVYYKAECRSWCAHPFMLAPLTS